MYARFREQLKELFDIKTRPEDDYLGNRISAESDKSNASIDRTAYINDLLVKFGLNDSKPMVTPMVQTLSNLERGHPVSESDHETSDSWQSYRVGTVLTSLLQFRSSRVLFLTRV